MELNWTNYRLAKECGFSKSSVSNWLKDKVKPDDSKLEVIARVTGVNKKWLKEGGEPIIWDRNEDFDISMEVSLEQELRYDIEQLYNSLEGTNYEKAEIISKQLGCSIEKVKSVLREQTDLLSVNTKIKTETRPRIPYTAAAGSLTNAMNGITADQCEHIPRINIFPEYDFTIIIKGDSMEPKYEGGDEVACKRIDSTSFIQWGKVHVLDTAQGILIKRAYEDGEKIRCVSYNPEYPDFSIDKSEIYSMSLVVGLVRL
nr:XRE family transcriptional regulator [Bacteroides intestinalis]